MSNNQVDVKLAQAGQILLEMAKEANVDLEALSDDQLAELLAQIKDEMEDRAEGGEGEGGDEGGAPEGGEGGEMPEEKLSSDVTFADVAAELAKFAQAENIDMAKVSREEYHEAFEAMAQQMTSPDYAQQKIAEAEAFEKLAEADIIGRQMARSFMDEMKTASVKERLASVASAAGKGLENLGGKAVRAASGANPHIDPKTKRNIGAGIVGTGVAAGAAGGAGLASAIKGRDNK